MPTTKQKCIEYLYNKGMSESDANAVLERAKPEIESGDYRMAWDRPASVYPDQLYAVIFMILNRHGLEYIDETCPQAMKRELKLEINCGEKTCASEPGKFCQFVGTRRMGTEYVCRLFPCDDDSVMPLSAQDGWLQRLPQCLEAEVERIKS